jgi:hypothetical protein
LALPGLASLFSAWGLLLRLGRDEQTFRTLPVTRPECAAINGDTGLLHSLEYDLRRLASKRRAPICVPQLRAGDEAEAVTPFRGAKRKCGSAR